MRPIPFRNLVTVVAGDTLSSLAERYLGDANAHQTLYELNRHTIDTDFRAYCWKTLPWNRRYRRPQDYLRVGTVLRVPDRPKPVPPRSKTLRELQQEFATHTPSAPLTRRDMAAVLNAFLGA